MQKIIVTSSEFTGYSTIFSISGECIDLHFEDEVSQDTFEDLCFETLPFEIRYDIFERVILNMIKSGLIKKALKCLLTSSSQLCRLFYTKYVGNFDLNMSQILDHLICLFKMIDSITDEMYAKSNSFEELSLSMECLNPKSIDIHNKEWPLRELGYNFNDLALISTANPNTKKIITGPSYCDLVWIEGLENKGVVEATMIKGPILVLEVYCIVGEIECPLYLRRTNFFRNVVRLLKLCLGPKSGVYLTVSIDGFFGLLTEVV